MIYAIFLACAILAVTANGASAVETPVWQPHDFEFRSDTPHENPFLVRFEARVTGPGGREMIVPGFCDGDGVWKIRFSPTAKGEWSLVTSSDDPQLDGKTIRGINCVAQTNPSIRGGLRIDPSHPRHFIREDGSRFFLMGFECDWLWALDAADPELPVVNAFLDKLSVHGFDYIVMNVYAHDTPWRKGHTGAHDYGPPPVYPWEGTNERPKHERLNLDFWRHYDRVIEAMHQRGIIAHIMTKVYNKMVNWPERNSPAEDLYYRTLIARYSAYPNVVWDFSKEAHNERDFDYKVGRIRFIRENDPYRRPITVHDDSANYDRGAYDDLLDYQSDQQHSDWYQTVLKQRTRREWPVVNVEFGYEWGPKGKGDSTYPPCQSPEDVLIRAWEVCMAGGYASYYYTYAAWDIIHPEHTPPGYANFKRLREFFEGTRYWEMEPHDEFLSRGHCLANPGKEYIIFHGEPGEFTLTIEGAESPLSLEWFQPLTGRRLSTGRLGDGTHKVTSPPSWDAPLVLYLR